MLQNKTEKWKRDQEKERTKVVPLAREDIVSVPNAGKKYFIKGVLNAPQ